MEDDSDPPIPPPPGAGTGVSWDGATWVDVDDAGHWHPSPGQRGRALIVLGLLFGTLFLAAALASVDDGDAGQVAVEPTTTAASATTTASTTTVDPEPAPSSLDGDEPPPQCDDDDRDAEPLRDATDIAVQALNATSTPGHAGEATDDFEAAGYQTRFPRDTTRGAKTSVAYVEGFCAEAVAAVDVLDLDADDADEVDIVPVDRTDRGIDPDADLIVTLGERTR